MVKLLQTYSWKEVRILIIKIAANVVDTYVQYFERSGPLLQHYQPTVELHKLHASND